MSDRPLHLFNKHIIQDGDMSGTIDSEVVRVDKALTYSIQVIWSGTGLDGELDLLGSNDGGTTYTPLISSPIAVDTDSDSQIIEVRDSATAFVSVVLCIE